MSPAARRFPQSDRPAALSEVIVQASDHYIVISADTHAGGSHQQYREFLDPKYRDDFDAWREKYKNPFKDLKDTDLRIRNWDDERARRRPERRRRHRRGHLPEYGAAVLPELRALRPAADAGRVRAPPRRHPGAQPLDGRLRLPQARGARRHRPDLPQRRRRRDRRRQVVPRERPARRRPGRLGAAHLRLDQAAVRPGATTRCGRSARSSACRSTPTPAPADRSTRRRRPCRWCTSWRSRSTRSGRSRT